MRTIIFFILLFLTFNFTPKVLAQSADILFTDNFNDGNFSGWAVSSGNWTIDSGQLISLETGTINLLSEIHRSSNQWDNYSVELDLNATSGVDAGIKIREALNGDAYVFNLRHGEGPHDTPQIKFWKAEGGLVNLISSTKSVQLRNNVWYHIKVEVFNENIKLWVDDQLAFDYSDPGTQIKKGGIGLQSWTGANGFIQVRFDNIKISSLNSAGLAKTPLILIPGIGGSELRAAEDTFWSKPDGHGGVFNFAYPAGEKVWVNELEAAKPGDDDYFDILKMGNDGITSEANLELTGQIFAGSYQQTIDFFVENGYQLNETLFVFPYDWRKDIRETAPLLDQKIEQIKIQTGAQKVDIVAHSMGGLVARNYIADPNRAQNVRKLFALGTPHLGTVEFLKNLRYGGCLKYPLGPFCLTLAPSEMRDVLQNLIGGYQLSPSQKYFEFYDGNNNLPLPFRDDADIDENSVTGKLNYEQIKQLLTNLGHNTGLFIPSEAFHNLDNSLTNTNGVEVYIISGSGIPTLGQIIERNVIDFAGIKIPKRDELLINGDQTVPLYSSSLSDPSRNLSFIGDAKTFYTNQNHGSLVSAGPTLNLISNILKANDQLPEGISTQPHQLKGQLLSVHSPVNIDIYDQSGNHTGPTSEGNIEINIPGSTFDSLGDAKFIWLPDGTYSIIFKSLGGGSFDFKIRTFKNDANTKTIIYKDIPLTDTTSAAAIFDTTIEQPPTVEVDRDSDGTSDFQISYTSQALGDDNLDQTPPKTEINLTGQQGDNGWFVADVTVQLKATDEESGVAKTDYTLNDGIIIKPYLDSFTISEEGIYKLKVKSTDNNGNEEVPQEVVIKVDKTPPEAKIFIDQTKKDLVIEGVDKNRVTIKKQGNFYIISDEAGNALKLEIRAWNKRKKDRFQIYSLKYNSSQPILLKNNHYRVKYSKDKLLIREQNFEIKNEMKIKIQYDQRTNKSTISRKEGREKMKEIKDGLIVLQLVTNQGVLQYNY